MGGLCGIISEQPCAVDLFYGTDYNSHLGTKRAGLATYEKDCGFFRGIHNLENAYFRSWIPTRSRCWSIPISAVSPSPPWPR